MTLIGLSTRWCLSCQLFLISEFLTPLPSWGRNSKPTLHPHTFLVSTSSQVFICSLVGGSRSPHYLSVSFFKVLLTQIGLWHMLWWVFSRDSFLPWKSCIHSFIQIHLCFLSGFWSLLLTCLEIVLLILNLLLAT